MRYQSIWFSLFLFSCATSASATTWYVDQGATGTGSGDSWGNAFTSIQAAVDAATVDSDDEVWVAAGVYTAASEPLLTMKAGVDIYGGFDTADTLLTDRDWTANLTTIDGQDARRCVIGANNARLDGFTVKRGNILGHGGGMINDSVSPTVEHCIFTLNNNSGTGMSGGRGGAIYNTNSSPSILHCTFYKNSSNGGGGGIYNYLASPEIHYCVFEENDTNPAYSSGGIACSESTITMSNCVFYNNSANSGAGLGTYKSDGVITNCVFAANTASASVNAGAGLFINNGPAPTITNCIVWGNSPDNLYTIAASPAITYSLIEGDDSGTGNIDKDPKFVDISTGNLRLLGGSPCIDSGDDSAVSALTDLDNNPRTVGVVDMGAYELKTSVRTTSPPAHSLAVAADSLVSATLNADIGVVTAASKIFSLASSFSPLLNETHVDLSYDNADPFVLSLEARSDFHAGEVIMATVFADDLDIVPHSWKFRVAVSASSSGVFLDSGQSLGVADSAAIALGDLTGDGDLDAFVANDGAANTVWFNDGAGAYTDSTQSLGSANSSGVALGDLDGDGDLDAFVANESQGNRVWLNDGAGAFSDSGQSLAALKSRSVALADVDGDGDLDAFVANYGQANFLWLNDGAGVFTSSGQSLGSSNSSTVSFGDVDLDGDLDAVVSNYAQANLIWLNNSRGVFTDSGQSLGVYNCAGVALGDLDADGAPDLFFTNYNQADRVWLNDGEGLFTLSTQSLGSAPGKAIELGDLDGDGDLDALVVNDSSPNTLWLNDGTGAFTDSTQALGSANSSGLNLGDLNDDGSLDAFLANSGEANTVWLNAAAPSVDTNAATLVDETSATLNGTVTDEGGASVTERGFYWDSNPLDTSDLSGASQEIITPDPGGSGAFSQPITGLSEGVTYYFLAYATSTVSTSYGAETTFSSKETPMINWANPEAISYGTTLSATQLNASANVAGSFVYTPASGSLLNAGVHSLETTFTPTDTSAYTQAAASVSLTVNQASPGVTVWPTASDLNYGQTLSESSLSGGSASVAGSFDFDAPATTLVAGMHDVAVTFTLTDSANYLSESGTLSITVHQATPGITTWPSASAISYGETVGDSTLSGGVAAVAGSFDFDAPWTSPNAGNYSAAVTFSPTDSANYTTVAGTVTVTVNQVAPSVTAWPTASDITTGDPLSASTLSGGLAEVVGAFTFDAPATVPNVGVYAAALTFSPSDTTNYTTVSGSVNVNVNKATPEISAWPSATNLTYGQSLADAVLSGGTASVAGSFAFSNPATTPNAGAYLASVTFSPTDAAHYNSVSGSVAMTVEKASPTVSTWPSASTLSYGQTLGDSTLSGGVVSPEGLFAFVAPESVPNAGTHTVALSFSPTDTANYTEATGSTTINVEKANPAVSEWPSASSIRYGQSLADSTLSGGSATPSGSFAFDAPWTTPNAGSYAAAVNYTPTDTANYASLSNTVSVTVNKATPVVNTWPTASEIHYGQSLADATLNGGAASVVGAFSFEEPDTEPGVGIYSATVLFTASSASNYTTVSGSVSVTVTQASPEITTWPSATAIVYGSPLSASTLSGGEAEVAGAFSFAAPETTPAAGDYAAAVLFTPEDEVNYLSSTGSTSVLVNKALPAVTTWPTATSIVYEQSLSEATLSGGSASVPGNFDYDAPWISPLAGDYTAALTFFPDASENYETVAGTVQVLVNKAVATIQFDDLLQVYDGYPKEARVSTIPFGLSVLVLYEDQTEAPTAVGQYRVDAAIEDSNYVGSATETLEILSPLEGEGEGLSCAGTYHSADTDQDGAINLSELLRLIQFYNSDGLYCATPPDSTEDGYVPGPGSDQDCCPHNSDFLPATPDWLINLSELLRLIQFYNFGAYYFCPEVPDSEDYYCPGLPPAS